MNAREQIVTKLIVQMPDAQIKIEVTPVLRGCVFEPQVRRVRPGVEDAFGFAEIQVVSFADLYAGKIMAALDRQHPRDLFDVRDLLANEASATICPALLLSISSVTTGRFRKCSSHDARTLPRSSHRDSRVSLQSRSRWTSCLRRARL
jgi:predicted nucleotidyltransferase component of viral defense system